MRPHSARLGVLFFHPFEDVKWGMSSAGPFSPCDLQSRACIIAYSVQLYFDRKLLCSQRL